MHAHNPLMKTGLALGIAVTAPAYAATITTIDPPAPGEASHAEILGSIYGGTFSAIGNDFSNGSITAVRVDDDSDQLYEAGIYSISTQATYARFDQALSYRNAEGTTPLFTVTGNETDADGNTESVEIDSDFRFVRSGSEGYIASTLPGENRLGTDLATTYRIEPVPDRTPPSQTATNSEVVIFFEDIPAGEPRADFDYNDLVVTVTQTSGIPEPGTIALAALGGLCILSRRRRRD